MQPEPADTDAIKQAIGKRIADLRRAKGMETPADLAKAIGYGTTTVQRYEAGTQEMGVVAAIAIANALGTTVQALLTPEIPPTFRHDALYFVSGERLKQLHAAKGRREVLAMLRPQALIGIEIDPHDVQVPKDQWHDTVKRAERLIEEKTGSPLQKLLQRLLRRPDAT